MGSVQGSKRAAAVVSKARGSTGRPAGMQAINPALYQQIRQAVRELSQPRPATAVN